MPPEVGPSVLDSQAFVRTFTQFSSPTQDFISDNLVSNETAYLDVAGELSRHTGGVYVGVGPEQNFSYIALSRPDYAFIVDLRRDNALLHLLYKALFETSRDRSEFLCALLGRSYFPDEAPQPDATLELILDHVAEAPRERGDFERQHRSLADRLRARPALGLSEADFASMERMHQRFFLSGLELRFELDTANFRTYPTLRELLEARSPDGKFGSFLAEDRDFRFVRDLQRRDRIAFAVGDFGKPETLVKLATHLREERRKLGTFYVSNVEQYLFGSPAWGTWLANLAAFPADGESRLLRAFLDQGRRHPAQRRGQRTASFLTPVETLLACERSKASRSYYAAVTRLDCGNPGSAP